MQVQHFFDKETNTLTYIVYDPTTRDGILIDPVLDYDPAGGVISTKSLQTILQFMQDQQINLRLVLETHAHADHLTSASQVRDLIPSAKMAIGIGITKVQQIFKSIFDLPDLATDGRQFDKLLENNKVYRFGSLDFKVIATPGHTPACCSYLFQDTLFVGDLLFMPDYGTGRCDFPGGSATEMYHSITQKIYTLPHSTKIYVGHDYQPCGRELKYLTSVAEQKENNIHIKVGTTEEAFVKFRNQRDQTLSPPKLLYPSVQYNINAGTLEYADTNGKSFFKTPITYKVS